MGDTVNGSKVYEESARQVAGGVQGATGAPTGGRTRTVWRKGVGARLGTAGWLCCREREIIKMMMMRDEALATMRPVLVLSCRQWVYPRKKKTLQSVVIMEDLQRAADIDSQLAAGSIMNQILDDQETGAEMLCDMLGIDSGMMDADLNSATHLTASDVEEEVDVVNEELEQEGDGDIHGGATSDDPDENSEGPPRDGKLKKPTPSVPHEP